MQQYQFAYVDVVDQEGAELAQNFKIESFPHIVFYLAKSDKFHVYAGSYEINSFNDVITRVSGHIPIYLTLQDLQQDIDNKFYTDGLVLGTFTNSNNYYNIFMKIANETNIYFPFAYSFSDEIAKFFDSNNGIIIIRPPILVANEKEKYFHISQVYNPKSVSEIIYKHFYGALSWLKPSTERIVLKSESDLVCLYSDVEPKVDLEHTKKIISDFIEVSKEFKKNIKFAVARKSDYSWFLDELGLFDNVISI